MSVQKTTKHNKSIHKVFGRITRVFMNKACARKNDPDRAQTHAVNVNGWDFIFFVRKIYIAYPDPPRAPYKSPSAMLDPGLIEKSDKNKRAINDKNMPIFCDRYMVSFKKIKLMSAKTTGYIKKIVIARPEPMQSAHKK